MITATVLWFAWYPIFIWQCFGVLSSISASSYKLEGNKKALFMGWLVGLGVLSYWLDMGLFSHLMAIGFCVSGMSPDHKRRPTSAEDEYHTIGTVVAMTAGFAGLYAVYGLLWPSAVMAVGSLLLWKLVNNHIWWIEWLSMGCIAGGLIQI